MVFQFDPAFEDESTGGSVTAIPWQQVLNQTNPADPGTQAATQSSAVGPNGRTFSEITGTGYESPAEREWYLRQQAVQNQQQSFGGATGMATFAPDARQFLSQVDAARASFGAGVMGDIPDAASLPFAPSVFPAPAPFSIGPGLEDIATGGGLTSLPPPQFGLPQAPAGGPVGPFFVPPTLTQPSVDPFGSIELQTAAQQGNLPSPIQAFPTIGGNTAFRDTSRPSFTNDLLGGIVQGAGTVAAQPGVREFLRGVETGIGVNPGAFTPSGGGQNVSAIDVLGQSAQPIAPVEQAQEFIERQLRQVPIVGGPLGLASELFIPTSPLEFAADATTLGLAGDLTDLARFRNVIRSGGGNAPVPDLPLGAAEALVRGTPVQSPAGQLNTLVGPGLGRQGPPATIAGGGPRDFRPNVDEFGNPIDVVPGSSLPGGTGITQPSGAPNVSEAITGATGPSTFRPEEPLVTLPDGQIRRANDVDLQSGRTHLDNAIDRFKARNPVNRDLSPAQLADAMSDAKTLGGRPLTRNVTQEDIVRAAGGTQDEIAYAREVDQGNLAMRALNDAVTGNPQRTELVGRMLVNDIDDITEQEAKVLADTIADARRATFVRGEVPRQELPPGQTTLFGEDAASIPRPNDRQWVQRRGNWELIGRDDPDFRPIGQSSALQPAPEITGGLPLTPQGRTLDQLVLQRQIDEATNLSPVVPGEPVVFRDQPFPEQQALPGLPATETPKQGFREGLLGGQGALRQAPEVPAGQAVPADFSSLPLGVQRLHKALQEAGLPPLVRGVDETPLPQAFGGLPEQRTLGGIEPGATPQQGFREGIPGGQGVLRTAPPSPPGGGLPPTRIRPAGEGFNYPEAIAQALGLPRAALASMDLSRIFRQDIALVRHAEWRRAVAAQFTAFFSPNGTQYAKDVDLAIRQGKWFEKAKKNGLYHAEMSGNLKEEQFYSRILQNMPLIGIPVRASERAFIVGGNKLRYDLFARYADQWSDALEAGKISQKQFDKRINDMAGYLNAATGRGSLPSGMAGALSVPFFAPRFLVSRPEMLWTLLDPRLWSSNSTSFAVRWIIAKDIASSYGMMGTLAGLAAYSGLADVEFDPRSADFMRLRFGDQRIDITGGWGTFYRQLTQLLKQETKAASGAIRSAEITDLLTRFTLYKMAPSTSLGISFLNEEDALGREVGFDTETLQRVIKDSFVPLFIQDFLDALEHEGLPAALAAGTLGFVGVASQTYPPSVGEQLNAEIANMNFSDATTGEPIVEWHKLDSGQKDEAKETNSNIAKVFAELAAADGGFNTSFEIHAAENWEKFTETGDYDNYTKSMDNASEMRSDAFDAADFPPLKNPGTFAKKVNDFYDSVGLIVDNEERSQAFRDFEESLTRDELAAWRKINLASSDENYEEIKRIEQRVRDDWWGARREAWPFVQAQFPDQLSGFDSFEEVFQEAGPGSPALSLASFGVEQAEIEILENDPELGAFLILTEELHPNNAMPAVVAEWENLKIRLGLPNK